MLDGESLGDGEVSPVIQWERRQQELNEEVMEKMRDEFTHRPDNFILNLLIASVQFYANYDKWVKVDNCSLSLRLSISQLTDSSTTNLAILLIAPTNSSSFPSVENLPSMH